MSAALVAGCLSPSSSSANESTAEEATDLPPMTSGLEQQTTIGVEQEVEATGEGTASQAVEDALYMMKLELGNRRFNVERLELVDDGAHLELNSVAESEEDVRHGLREIIDLFVPVIKERPAPSKLTIEYTNFRTGDHMRTLTMQSSWVNRYRVETMTKAEALDKAIETAAPGF